MIQVVDGGCRRGEVEHGIHGAGNTEGIADVGLDEVEARLPPYVLEVARGPRDQVVDAEHTPAAREKAVDEMAPDETGGPEDDRCLLSGHIVSDLKPSAACAAEDLGHVVSWQERREQMKVHMSPFDESQAEVSGECIP